MKLLPIKRTHIIQAAKIIDYEGIPHNYLFNNYWVKLPNKREYPFKHLVRKAYDLTNSNKPLDFQSNTGYRKYIEDLGFSFSYYKEAISFFDKESLIHFQNIAGKPYRKSSVKNIREGKVLFPLVKRVNVWAKKSLIENFQFKEDNHWQWSGTFKSYLWIRIYRENSSKKVYFVIGVNEHGELYIELNCQRSNHTGGITKSLSKEKISLFDEYIQSSEYIPKAIKKEEIKNYDWDSLIETTQNFIYQYAPLYDELEKITSPDYSIKSNLKTRNTLTQSSTPRRIKSNINKKRAYKGRIVDWSKKQIISKKLGDKGERLVIEYEKHKLNSLNQQENAEKVCKRLDGVGYDILSYDNKGNEIYIEVKTTIGNIDEPFYVSANEWNYFNDFPDNYYLYRLYEYDYENNTAKFYIFSAKELKKLNYSPTNYEVSIKN